MEQAAGASLYGSRRGDKPAALRGGVRGMAVCVGGLADELPHRLGGVQSVLIHRFRAWAALPVFWVLVLSALVLGIRPTAGAGAAVTTVGEAPRVPGTPRPLGLPRLGCHHGGGLHSASRSGGWWARGMAGGVLVLAGGLSA
jgi:hypothetical protein